VVRQTNIHNFCLEGDVKNHIERNRVELRDGVLILHQAPHASWRQQEKNAEELLRVFWEDQRNGQLVKQVLIEMPQKCAQ
jgi:hypothetical protein